MMAGRYGDAGKEISRGTRVGPCARRRGERSLVGFVPAALPAFGTQTQTTRARARMVALPQEPWTMHLALNRKRSRLALESDDSDAPYSREDEVANAPQSGLKKTKTQSELDEIDIIAPRDAWAVDVDSILSSPTSAPGSAAARPHNNAPRYAKGSSIIVLCVQGNLHLHYNLLWCAIPRCNLVWVCLLTVTTAPYFPSYTPFRRHCRLSYCAGSPQHMFVRRLLPSPYP
jgi:hypothetical protein